MWVYTIRRLLAAIPTLLLLACLTFFLIRLAPGGPFDSERAWPPEIQANIAHKYGLDQPVHQQFFQWMNDALHGDLKESFQYIGQPVSHILGESFSASFILGGIALLLAVLGGVTLGSFSAWKPYTRFDKILQFLLISGISLPIYLIASLCILIFSLYLGWLPPALWDGPSSAVLPILTLTWRPLCFIARLSRSSMLENQRADYVRTASSKGLPELVIVFKHILRNSLVPTATALGPIAANLITGSFVVEVIFQIPGIGRHFVQAVINRDYPLVMGVTLIYGIILIFTNLLSDLICGWLDPRIQFGNSQ